MPKKKTETIEDLPYEKAFAELEEIVKRLEGGELSLDDALALFERGQALAAHCGVLLDTAELKVKQLLPANGGYAMEEFEPGEEA